MKGGRSRKRGRRGGNGRKGKLVVSQFTGESGGARVGAEAGAEALNGKMVAAERELESRSTLVKNREVATNSPMQPHKGALCIYPMWTAALSEFIWDESLPSFAQIVTWNDVLAKCKAEGDNLDF